MPQKKQKARKQHKHSTAQKAKISAGARAAWERRKTGRTKPVAEPKRPGPAPSYEPDAKHHTAVRRTAAEAERWARAYEVDMRARGLEPETLRGAAKGSRPVSMWVRRVANEAADAILGPASPIVEAVDAFAFGTNDLDSEFGAADTNLIPNDDALPPLTEAQVAAALGTEDDELVYRAS